MARAREKQSKKKPCNVAKDGRNKSGQFAKGHKGYISDKKKSRQTRELREAFLNAVTPNDIRVIAKKLLSKAKRGDIVAIKEVFDRCMGKPYQTVEADLGDNTMRTLVDFMAMMAAKRAKNG